MSEVNSVSCTCCKELINKEASTCFHCGKNQNKIIRILNPTSQWLALIISIVLVLLSRAQFLEAKNQRKSANEALDRAKAAEERVTRVARATLPIFESSLGKIGIASGGYSDEEIEHLTRPLKEALKQNRQP